MKISKASRIILVLALLVAGVTVVAATVFGVAKKLEIPLGADKVSSKLKKGEVTESAKSSDSDTDFLLRTRQLRAIYVMNGDKISSIYLEVLNSPRKKVSFVEIPRSTKISISDELFRDLQSYSPTLPQFVKVSKLDGHFSANYRFEGMTRVFSDTLGENIDCWIACSEELFEMWTCKGYMAGEFHADDFFNIFDSMTDTKLCSIGQTESRMYYETYRDCEFSEPVVVPGDWEKTDYIISEITAKTLIEELKY